MKPKLIVYKKEQRLYASIAYIWVSLIKAATLLTLVLLNKSFNVLPK